MTKILSARIKGAPAPKQVTVNPWPRKPVVRRPIRAIPTLIKANPADALGLGGVHSMPRDPVTGLSIPAGSGRKATAGSRIVKKQPNLTTRPGKSRKVVKTPSPTNRGGVRNPFGKRSI